MNALLDNVEEAFQAYLQIIKENLRKEGVDEKIIEKCFAESDESSFESSLSEENSNKPPVRFLKDNNNPPINNPPVNNFSEKPVNISLHNKTVKEVILMLDYTDKVHILLGPFNEPHLVKFKDNYLSKSLKYINSAFGPAWMFQKAKLSEVKTSGLGKWRIEYSTTTRKQFEESR